MDPEKLRSHFLELVRLTSCDLAPDVESALTAARDREADRGRSTLDWMLKNVAEARRMSVPICQDTGTLLFFVEHGPDVRPVRLAESARWAVAEATRQSFLRPNAVDSLTGKNSGDNLGLGSPVLHFAENDRPGTLSVRLMLKGGGSENCGVQYSLPDRGLNAGRDLAGIKRCVLDAALRAQGFGCAPGTLGVGIGGDRMTSFEESKLQLLRELGDTNPDPDLAQLEWELAQAANQLEIGPMGFGGRTTVLGVKMGKRHRLPASFFVSVSYMCWAYRRRSMEITGDQVVYR